jgi:hypothetical protein
MKTFEEVNEVVEFAAAVFRKHISGGILQESIAITQFADGTLSSQLYCGVPCCCRGLGEEVLIRIDAGDYDQTSDYRDAIREANALMGTEETEDEIESQMSDDIVEEWRENTLNEMWEEETHPRDN